MAESYVSFDEMSKTSATVIYLRFQDSRSDDSSEEEDQEDGWVMLGLHRVLFVIESYPRYVYKNKETWEDVYDRRETLKRLYQRLLDEEPPQPPQPGKPLSERVTDAIHKSEQLIMVLKAREQNQLLEAEEETERQEGEGEEEEEQEPLEATPNQKCVLSVDGTIGDEKSNNNRSATNSHTEDLINYIITDNKQKNGTKRSKNTALTSPTATHTTANHSSTAASGDYDEDASLSDSYYRHRPDDEDEKICPFIRVRTDFRERSGSFSSISANSNESDDFIDIMPLKMDDMFLDVDEYDVKQKLEDYEKSLDEIEPHHDNLDDYNTDDEEDEDNNNKKYDDICHLFKDIDFDMSNFGKIELIGEKRSEERICCTLFCKN